MTAAPARLAPGLLSRDEGPVRILTIDREDRRNALDSVTLRALEGALAGVEGSGPVRVVVLTGSGPLAFCAGIDLKDPEPADASDGERRAFRALLLDVFRAAATMAVPLVCRVNGLAMGAGLGLVAAVDLVVCAEHAWFSTPEVDVARWPLGVGALLQRVLPYRVALELCMTARRMSADEALRLHLVNRVVPFAELDRATSELTEVLASKPRLAMSEGRRAFRRMAELPLDTAFEDGLDVLDRLLRAGEAPIGPHRFAGGAPDGGS
jgi:crotonobetainyl-CoA hydratase